MAHTDIILKGKKIGPHKAFMAPSFGSPTVLVDDQFDYVSLWLKRKSFEEAETYWAQARNFYKASLDLPNESRALTSYYCIMNAAKTLLAAKGIQFTSQHGLSGKSLNNKTSLTNEVSDVKGSGILPSLSQYFGANITKKRTNLKNVIYNLPFVHRAYTITFSSSQNLFIPIADAHFVRQNGGNEAWFCAKITDPRYQKDSFIKKQRGWERDVSEVDGFIIRCKHRFKWRTRGVPLGERMKTLVGNHRKIRRDIKYIQGSSRLWYFKRNDKAIGTLAWPTPALIFIAMHRLSELTRYDPNRLHHHLNCQHNWLIGEFLRLANDNFVDQIVSDITGQEFMVPGYRK